MTHSEFQEGVPSLPRPSGDWLRDTAAYWERVAAAARREHEELLAAERRAAERWAAVVACLVFPFLMAGWLAWYVVCGRNRDEP